MHTPWLTIDFSRPVTAKEYRTLTRRKKRLDGTFGHSVTGAMKTLSKLGGSRVMHDSQLRIRHDFCYLRDPISSTLVSDRTAPPRSERPPATQVSTSRGVALRLFLMGIAAAQIMGQPGHRPPADLRALPLIGHAGTTAWVDLIATEAEHMGDGRTVSSVRDKKTRSLRAALATLDDAQLVNLVRAPGTSTGYESFELLDEAGDKRVSSLGPDQYRIPKTSDDRFALPAGFVLNGWLHILEDSEITVLLMIACQRGALDPKFADDVHTDEVAIPADTRLRHYGIHRDPFTAARKTLEWFGLIEVREIDRHDDGRATDSATMLHRLKLRPEGFGLDGLTVTHQVITDQLSRRSPTP